MYPIINVFGKEIGTYTIAALFGIFAAALYACRRSRAFGLDDNNIIFTALFGAIGALVGSHLLYGITNLRAATLMLTHLDMIDSFKALAECLFYIFGGSVYYGGLIGGAFAGWLYMRGRKITISEYSDIFAAAIPLFHAFGRVGCFLGGCCYGIESSIGFVYSVSLVPEANGVMRFPVQLLESGVELALFGIVAVLHKRKILKGKLFSLYLALYAFVRFFLEFIRGDDIRGFVFGLSTSQIISILVLAVIAYKIIAKRALDNF